MPDFYRSPVRQDLEKTAACHPCDVWDVVQQGQPTLTNTLEAVWWAFGRWASELRLDIELDGATTGDQVRVEVWSQPQNKPGGGVKLFSGTLTVPNQVDANQWFTIGAVRGPFSDGWGWRAQLVSPVIAGDTGRRIRGKMVGVCAPGGTLGTVLLGENVVSP